MSKRQSWNTILTFCILIFGFSIATIIAPKREFSETENRSLAQMPEVTVKAILSGAFESDYEDYLTDQFVARDGWIGLKTDVERTLGKQESKDIYFAGDDYLIEKHTGSFTAAQASANIRLLAQFMNQYLDQFGADHMTTIIVPNAVKILEDKLPAFAAPFDEDLYLEQIRQALPEQIWFESETVLKQHADDELYYHTDHHWTTDAAFYVYQEWAEGQELPVPDETTYQITTVSDQFEGTIQSKLGIHTVKDKINLYLPKDDPFYTVVKNDLEEMEYSLYDYSALESKDKYSVFFGGNQALIRIGTRAGSGRRILVIKDSYAHCFIPFLLKDFDEIDVVDLRYYNQKISELIEGGDYTDLLFLYNASGFAEDTALAKLMS